MTVPKGLRPHHCQHQHQSLCLCLHLPCTLHHPMLFLFLRGYHHHSFLLSFHLGSLHPLGTLSPLPDIPQLLQTCHQLGSQQQCQRLIQTPSQRHKHLLSLGRSFTESNGGLKRSPSLPIALHLTLEAHTPTPSHAQVHRAPAPTRAPSAALTPAPTRGRRPIRDEAKGRVGTTAPARARTATTAPAPARPRTGATTPAPGLRCSGASPPPNGRSRRARPSASTSTATERCPRTT